MGYTTFGTLISNGDNEFKLVGADRASIFSMFSGVISGNAVSGLSGHGGGVSRYKWGGTFNWYGSEIYGNTADNNEDTYDP